MTFVFSCIAIVLSHPAHEFEKCLTENINQIILVYIPGERRTQKVAEENHKTLFNGNNMIASVHGSKEESNDDNHIIETKVSTLISVLIPTLYVYPYRT